jgi:hypothetical protein
MHGMHPSLLKLAGDLRQAELYGWGCQEHFGRKQNIALDGMDGAYKIYSL